MWFSIVCIKTRNEEQKNVNRKVVVVVSHSWAHFCVFCVRSCVSVSVCVFEWVVWSSFVVWIWSLWWVMCWMLLSENFLRTEICYYIFSKINLKTNKNHSCVQCWSRSQVADAVEICEDRCHLNLFWEKNEKRLIYYDNSNWKAIPEWMWHSIKWCKSEMSGISNVFAYCGARRTMEWIIHDSGTLLLERKLFYVYILGLRGAAYRFSQKQFETITNTIGAHCCASVSLQFFRSIASVCVCACVFCTESIMVL